MSKLLRLYRESPQLYVLSLLKNGLSISTVFNLTKEVTDRSITAQFKSTAEDTTSNAKKNYEALNNVISKEEIVNVLRTLNSEKAGGPDGSI